MAKSIKMKWIIISSLVVFFSACCPCRKVVGTVKESDSVKVRVIERVELVPDTVVVEIPVEKEKVVTKDTISILSNSYSISEAIISKGMLTHTLSTTGTVDVPIKIPTKIKDSIVYREIEVKNTEIIQEKLTLADKAEYVLAGIGIGLLLCIIAKFLLK